MNKYLEEAGGEDVSRVGVGLVRLVGLKRQTVTIEVPKKYCLPISELETCGHGYIANESMKTMVIDTEKLRADGYDFILNCVECTGLALYLRCNEENDELGIIVGD